MPGWDEETERDVMGMGKGAGRGLIISADRICFLVAARMAFPRFALLP